MLQELYTWDKLRELERTRRARLPGRLARSKAAPPGARALRRAGRLLRNAGTGLERWAEPRGNDRPCCAACD
jgi:hypothetical protein